MEFTDKTSKNSRQSSRDKSLERRSLNPEGKSKSSRQVQNLDRGHNSQLIQTTITEVPSAKRSEVAVSSLEKHRVAVSSKQKGTDHRKDMDSAGTSRVKNKSEIQTIKDGERWVSVAENTYNGHHVISLLNEPNEDENVQSNHRKEASKKKSKSKKKVDEKDAAEKQKNQEKSPKPKPRSKSYAKNTDVSRKKSAKKPQPKSHKLKRNQIQEDDQLTNQPHDNPVQMKSRKKPSNKSKGKSNLKADQEKQDE